MVYPDTQKLLEIVVDYHAIIWFFNGVVIAEKMFFYSELGDFALLL